MTYKVSPVKGNFKTIDHHNLISTYSKNHNNIEKSISLLEEVKKYKDKFTINKNLENKKIDNLNVINNNINTDNYIVNSKSKSTISNQGCKNYFKNNSSYNKLVQMDKLILSNKANYSNTQNNPSIVKNETSRCLSNNNLIQNGLNSNAKNKNNVPKHETLDNSYKNSVISNNSNKMRSSSSNINKILKVDQKSYTQKFSKANKNNFKKINSNLKNSSDDKIYSNSNLSSRNKSETMKIKDTKYNNENLFMPNLDLIIKCLKYIKFPKNYIDNYKIVLDKLQNSKNNRFLISVLEEKRHLVN